MSIGSANVTERALGDFSGSNFESIVVLDQAPHDYLVFLQSIISQSKLLVEEEYRKLTSEYEAMKHNLKEVVKAYEQSSIVDTLLDDGRVGLMRVSELPLSSSPEVLVDFMIGEKETIEIDEVMHDLAIFGRDVSSNLSEDEILARIRNSFFGHPFVTSLSSEVQKTGTASMRFGAVKQWIQDNCVDDPRPSRKGLTENVNVLFNWFIVLAPESWVVDVPGKYSEVLKYIGNRRSTR